MEFIPISQYVEKPNKYAWYYEMFEIPAPESINEVTEADAQILQQIVPAGSRHSLQTLNRQDFKLAFCPDAGTTSRWVSQPIHLFINLFSEGRVINKAYTNYSVVGTYPKKAHNFIKVRRRVDFTLFT